VNPRLHTDVRHSIRPLSVFSFCGQPMAALRDEYQLTTKDLPPCPECRRARDKAVLMHGGRYRRKVSRITKQP
jgi:hypothetical protein